MAGEHEHGVKVLPRYFQPDFVQLAVNLPPSCDFWSAMEEEIDDKARLDDSQPGDTRALMDFLSFFFCSSVVQDVEEKITLLSNSSLGLTYTFRKGNAEIAKSILADIHEHPSLENFFGWVSLTSQSLFSEPSIVSAARGNHGEPLRVSAAGQGQDEGEASNRGKREDGGGSGGVRRGRDTDDDIDEGGDGGDDSHEDVDKFLAVEQNIVMIHMSVFSTPPKQQFGRSQTLKSRSLEFSTNASILGDLSNTTRIYDPWPSQKGRVLLYHGTRTSSLASFKSKGISPGFTRNEFSVTHAFYVSNSLRQAFEHPMHKHISHGIDDPVSVMVFEVDVAALHGEKVPVGETSEFKCKWFQVNTPAKIKAWSDFCVGNMKTTASFHGYDIVIGPICHRLEDGSYGKLYGEMPNAIPLTQIALCTRRARAWIQRCFKQVYMEKRSVASQAA